ncbi:MAG: beta-propeller fold lactonase family protein [Acidobacteria bacterium]|nr:beta-propeller fold lactonase family protein [Acidobacteriota bacterium]
MGLRRRANPNYHSSLLFVLLAFVLLPWAAGCGSGSSSTSSNQPPNTTPTTSGSPAPGGSSSSPATARTFVYAGQQNVLPSSTGKIAGFVVSADGSAQATPGSPYSGSGSGLAASPSGDILFGSDYSNVESWSVASDGSLSRLNNLAGTFGNLLMIDNSGHTLYAQEFYVGGTGNNDYAFLSIGSNAALQKIGATPQSVDGGRFVFTPDDSRAYGTFCYHLEANIVGYNRNSDGSLTGFNTNAPLPNDGEDATFCPTGLAISPDGKYLVATLVSVLSTTGAFFGVYTINSDGTLSPVAGSPYAAAAQGRDVVFDPSGKFILVAETDGLAAYQFTPGSAPVRMSGSPAGGAAMDRVVLSHSGQLAFSISSAAQNLYIFTFSNGTLTQAPGSPQALGFAPGSLAEVER